MLDVGRRVLILELLPVNAVQRQLGESLLLPSLSSLRLLPRLLLSIVSLKVVLVVLLFEVRRKAGRRMGRATEADEDGGAQATVPTKAPARLIETLSLVVQLLVETVVVDVDEVEMLARGAKVGGSGGRWRFREEGEGEKGEDDDKETERGPCTVAAFESQLVELLRSELRLSRFT